MTVSTWRACLTGFISVGLAACASLPDTSGYTAATSEMRAAISTTGSTVHRSLRNAVDEIPESDTEMREDASDTAERFRTAWNTTDQATQIMVDYAQSVEAISDAGESSREDLDNLLGSLGSLATIAGLANPLATVVEEPLFAVASQVWGHIQNARAMRKLEDTLAAANPAISAIIPLLAEKLDESAAIYRNAMAARRDELRMPARFGSIITGYESHQTRLERAERAYGEALADGNMAEAGRIRREVETLQAQLAPLQPRYDEYSVAVRDIAQQRRAGVMVIDAAKSALRAWSDAHRNLAAAVSQDRPFNAQTLISAALEVRQVLQTYREAQLARGDGGNDDGN